MRIHKLTSTDAFVVFDLDGASSATGPVRAGDKILASSATEFARCTTYAYASLGMQKSGASAGINAPEASRAEAIAKFVAEIEKLTVDGTFLPDHSKVVTADDLASLRSHDPRVAIDDDALIAQGAASTRSMRSASSWPTAESPSRASRRRACRSSSCSRVKTRASSPSALLPARPPTARGSTPANCAS